MPITGIPLPFVSYGSSFMVVNFALHRAHRLGVLPYVHTVRLCPDSSRKEGLMQSSP